MFDYIRYFPWMYESMLILADLLVPLPRDGRCQTKVAIGFAVFPLAVGILRVAIAVKNI